MPEAELGRLCSVRWEYGACRRAQGTGEVHGVGSVESTIDGRRRLATACVQARRALDGSHDSMTIQLWWSRAVASALESPAPIKHKETGGHGDGVYSQTRTRTAPVCPQ